MTVSMTESGKVWKKRKMLVKQVTEWLHFSLQINQTNLEINRLYYKIKDVNFKKFFMLNAKNAKCGTCSDSSKGFSSRVPHKHFKGSLLQTNQRLPFRISLALIIINKWPRRRVID